MVRIIQGSIRTSYYLLSNPVWKKSIGNNSIQYFFREFPILYREKSIRFNIYQYFFFIRVIFYYLKGIKNTFALKKIEVQAFVIF